MRLKKKTNETKKNYDDTWSLKKKNRCAQLRKKRKFRKEIEKKKTNKQTKKQIYTE